MTVEIGDATHELDARLIEAVIGLVDLVQRGVSVQLDGLPVELTTGQAADILGISRPTVAKLVDAGDLPSTMVGTHRRIPTHEVFAYRERARRARKKALDEIVELSDELSLYSD